MMPGFTCFRYLFLSVPAYMFMKGVNIKNITPFVLFSIVYLALMIYSKAPVVADPLLPDGWEAQTGLAFFYTLLLFVLLTKFHGKIKNSKIRNYVSHLGVISWEVFCVQMVLIGIGVLDILGSKMFCSGYLRVGFKVEIRHVFVVLPPEFQNSVGFSHLPRAL